jgi:hypothetical protein
MDIGFNSPFFEESALALQTAREIGDLIACEIVVSELSPRFVDHQQVGVFLSQLGIEFVRSSPQALHRAGGSFASYVRNRGDVACSNCGTVIEAGCASCGTALTSRQHLIADFMIGSHALVHAGRLLTRDRGYYRKYFPGLVLV